MKLLAALIFSTILFCSCGSVRKSANKTKSSFDSTATKTISQVDVKKKDTSAASKETTEENKVSDSSYSKKTVIEEYFSDEMDFSEEDSEPIRKTQIKPEDYLDATDSTKKKPSKFFYYKVTTITETGNISKEETAIKKKDQELKVNTVDSTSKGESQVTEVRKKEEILSKKKDRTVLFGGVGFTFLLLVILYIIYRKYKRRRQLIDAI